MRSGTSPAGEGALASTVADTSSTVPPRLTVMPRSPPPPPSPATPPPAGPARGRRPAKGRAAPPPTGTGRPAAAARSRRAASPVSRFGSGGTYAVGPLGPAPGSPSRKPSSPSFSDRSRCRAPAEWSGRGVGAAVGARAAPTAVGVGGGTTAPTLGAAQAYARG